MHDETLILPIHKHYSPTCHNRYIKHNIHQICYTNIQQHSKAKKIYLPTAATQQTFPQPPPPTVTTTGIITNVWHIHISIVSRHLATRGNNKILRTPLPHISSSEEILPYLTGRTLLQLRTNKLPSLKSYLHKVDTKSHPSTLWPTYSSHTLNTHLFNCTHIRTTLSSLNLWTDPTGVTALLVRWTENLAGG